MQGNVTPRTPDRWVIDTRRLRPGCRLCAQGPYTEAEAFRLASALNDFVERNRESDDRDDHNDPGEPFRVSSSGSGLVAVVTGIVR